MQRLAVASLVLAASLLVGCAYGVQARIYATSGSDVSLTRSGKVDVAAGEVCPHYVESSYLFEKASELKDYMSGDSAPEPEAKEPLPACQSFQIHERMAFDSTASIDVQELLRGEFGTGHEFRNISIKIKISWFDWLLNVFTLGLANSQTIEVTGDRFKAG